MRAPFAVVVRTYSSTAQGYRVCQGPDGYRSTESEWMRFKISKDNRGAKWTSSRWNGLETTTGLL